MSDQRPIGIFDSGIGGLTVANAISHLLPNEKLIYFGDTVHLPYGEKSADAIRYYCIKISKFLLEHNCKMIVIACNSASSAAYDTLLDFFSKGTIFVNVVDPLVDVVLRSERERVGIIATKATVNSRAYEEKLIAADKSLCVSSLATPLLVPMIEEGFYENNISHSVLDRYLHDNRLKDIDCLLLACTHYPLVKKEIQKILTDKVLVLDSAVPVAHKVKDLLEKNSLLSDRRAGENQFFVSDYTRSFQETTRLFYGREVNLKEASIW